MSKRIPYWDNVKFFLMLLVVIGHFMPNDTEKLLIAYRFIYIFHMPVFLFVAGIFSRLETITVKKRVSGLIILGTVSNVVWFLLNNYLFFESTKKFYVTDFYVFRAISIPWFCFSLAICTALAYFMKNIKWQVVIFISLSVGLFSSYDALIMQSITLGKTASWFVYFYAGTLLSKYREDIAQFAGRPYVKVIAFFAFAVCIIAVYVTRNNEIFSILRSSGTFTASVRGVSWGEKSIAYIVTTIVSIVFLLAVPTHPIKLVTKCGRSTLQVYFWHMIVRTVVFYFGWNKQLCKSTVGTIAYFLIIIMIDILLSLPIFRFPTEQLIDVYKGEELKEASE